MSAGGDVEIEGTDTNEIRLVDTWQQVATASTTVIVGEDVRQ